MSLAAGGQKLLRVSEEKQLQNGGRGYIGDCE